MNNVVELKTIGEYTLLERYKEDSSDLSDFIGYVVVWLYEPETKAWAQGHYFDMWSFKCKEEAYLYAYSFLLAKAKVIDKSYGDLKYELESQDIPYETLVDVGARLGKIIREYESDFDFSDEFSDDVIKKLELDEHYVMRTYWITKTMSCEVTVAHPKGKYSSDEAGDGAIEIARNLEDYEWEDDHEYEYKYEKSYDKEVSKSYAEDELPVDNILV